MFGRPAQPYGPQRGFRRMRYIYNDDKWLLWYYSRHGGLEQAGLALHAREDLGF